MKLNDIKGITIDFNEDTFESLSEKLKGDSTDYVVIMNHKQFQTFKLMYKFTHKEIDEHGFTKETIIQPTPMGHIYELQYRVED